MFTAPSRAAPLGGAWLSAVVPATGDPARGPPQLEFTVADGAPLPCSRVLSEAPACLTGRATRRVWGKRTPLSKAPRGSPLCCTSWKLDGLKRVVSVLSAWDAAQVANTLLRALLDCIRGRSRGIGCMQATARRRTGRHPGARTCAAPPAASSCSAGGCGPSRALARRPLCWRAPRPCYPSTLSVYTKCWHAGVLLTRHLAGSRRSPLRRRSAARAPCQAVMVGLG